MPVALKGATSGDITLTAPAVAGSTTITFPATTGDAVVDVATQTLTNKTLTSPTITGANVSSMASSVITAATAQASTTGSEIPFTGIPSWVRRITLLFHGVSATNASDFLVQIGSGSYTASGYVSQSSEITTAVTTAAETTGFNIQNASGANTNSGSMTICLITGNTWVASGVFSNSNNATVTTAGSVALSGTLDRLRVTGVVAFDAGTINILYE